MSLATFIKSFGYALQGLVFLLRTQRNARVHLLATLLVCGAGIYVGLSRTEWVWIVAAIVLVWSAEAFNTALEQLADALHPERHPGVGRAKDVAAAAVLIAALGAALIGILVFLPHLAGAGEAAAVGSEKLSATAEQAKRDRLAIEVAVSPILSR